MSKFSETLTYLRKNAGLSQQELADRLHMSRSIVGMYESGHRKPSMEVLTAIADIFSVNTDVLTGRVGTGRNSEVFCCNVERIIANASPDDLQAAGIDITEVNHILSGTIPLTLDNAGSIAAQLGESLDSLLELEMPDTTLDAGQIEILKIFSKLTPENRSKLLELSRLYLSAQQNRGGTE